MSCTGSYPSRLTILSRALRGEVPYLFGISLAVPDEDYIERKVQTVTALSHADALAQIRESFPEGSEITLSLCNSFVCIQRFLAYPCRAARWVLFHGEMVRIERKAVQAVLAIQSIESVRGKINGGGKPIVGPVAADAESPHALPNDKTSAAVALRNPVSVDVHEEIPTDASEMLKTGGLDLSPEKLTPDSIEAIRRATYDAFRDTCGVMARVDNGLIDPEEASRQLRSALAPLQISGADAPP